MRVFLRISWSGEGWLNNRTLVVADLISMLLPGVRSVVDSPSFVLFLSVSFAQTSDRSRAWRVGHFLPYIISFKQLVLPICWLIGSASRQVPWYFRIRSSRFECWGPSVCLSSRLFVKWGFKGRIWTLGFRFPGGSVNFHWLKKIRSGPTQWKIDFSIQINIKQLMF